MKFLPLFIACARALVRNPMRATLTILGIVIGIAAVIAMMEIGSGSSQQIQNTIASMGANTLTIRPASMRWGGVSTGAGARATLLPGDAETLALDCPSVVRASVIVYGQGQAVYGSSNWSPNQILGVSPDYFTIRDWDKPEEGTIFTEEDVKLYRRVCVVGQTIVKELFKGKSPIGKTFRLKGVSLTVIGVLESKGSNMAGHDQDDIILAPWTSIKYRVASGGSSSSSFSSESTYERGATYPSSNIQYYPEDRLTSSTSPHPRRFQNVDQIIVEIVDPAKSADSIEEITSLLRARHRIPQDSESDFRVWDMAEMSRAMSSTTKVMTKLLLIVAMISLVVGGVGIMNIMLVSVTERTREIGLRMAVGARPRDIMRQFLLESTLLCLVGGIFGILLGRGLSVAVTYFMKWPTASSPEAMALAFIVSAAIGIVFGWYPSMKASNLDPIDALRHE